MEILNKISVVGLSAVLMLAIGVTAEATALIEQQVANTVVVDKKITHQNVNKEQLRKKYQQLPHRTVLGKLTDKKAYK
tara:strand:+ start:142 stop:375 length:234 start_codon:yes stop_codon:yes gene_type:complete